MRRRIALDDCWIHVFEETIFGGRGRLLGVGDRAAINKVRSLIVGPGAIAKVVIRDGREVISLPPRKLVTDFSKVSTRKDVAHVRVVRAGLKDHLS